MADDVLQGCRILIAEDEYMLADDLRAELREAGATVIGPVGNVADALDLIGSEPQVDGAILDINMRGEMIFPVADLLAQRGVPIVFATGYDSSAIPDRFRNNIRCEKPVDMAKVARAIRRVITA